MIFPKDVETVDLMERLQRRMMRRRIKVNTKGFSKIFKLDENNQYGFAKTKPLPIGVFKKEAHLDMDILKNYIKMLIQN